MQEKKNCAKQICLYNSNNRLHCNNAEIYVQRGVTRSFILVYYVIGPNKGRCIDA